MINAAKGLDPLFARSYQMAAKMNFEMRRPVMKLRGMNRKDFYDYLPESDPTTKSFYLVVEKGDSLPLNYTSAWLPDRRGAARSMNILKSGAWRVTPQ